MTHMAETVTIIQAARELHMSPQTLRYMMASGRIAIGDCGTMAGEQKAIGADMEKRVTVPAPQDRLAKLRERLKGT